MKMGSASEQYRQAYKLGRSCCDKLIAEGKNPYPPALDEIYADALSCSSRNLGVMEIPTDLIVGTKTAGRQRSFAANFLPLMDLDTEFSNKWISLCSDHLGEEGIRDPIECYEYLGKFYVAEGNKRVSVLKSFSAATVTGVVTRLIPPWSEDKEIRLYYEFMEFFRLSGTYLLGFSEPGSYMKLLNLMGAEPDRVWDSYERRAFSSTLFRFASALKAETGETEKVGDILLELLGIYSYKTVHDMSEKELAESIRKLIPDIRLRTENHPIDLNTDVSNETAGLFSRLISGTAPLSSVSAAFIYEFEPEKSSWIAAHEMGRKYLESELGDKVKTKAYVVRGEDRDGAFDAAVADGATVVFAVTPSLIRASRRAALKYPKVKLLNCSVSLPFPEVRTYYSRIYEGKFISGALAGAMTRTDRVGYIASNPIYGVPAGINAFALGARLTNPEVKIYLKWTSVSLDTFAELKELGVDLISNRDVPTPSQAQDVWGLCRVEQDGSMRPVGSPYWNWGKMYVHIIENILCGNWDRLSYKNSGKAVNYWWGISTGSVDIHMCEDNPDSILELAELLKKGIAEDYIRPFERKIRAQDGSVVNDGSRNLSLEEILNMDWLCDSVVGSIPKYEELLPISKKIVELQGIYNRREI